MRSLLIVSPHFPPLNAPDMQRVRMSLPYYRACGWEPIVLCVGDEWQQGTREPELERTYPQDITVIRSRALSPRWTRLLGLRNTGLRCWLYFLFAGSKIIRREKIDLVFFSTTQFALFPLGRIWRMLHGVPYVFDMQDPWRTDYYSRPGARRPPGGWKYQFARITAWLLERWSFGRVAGVMSVSPNYLEDLRQRYPSLATVPAAVIHFGASRHDLLEAMRLPVSIHSIAPKSSEVHFVYTGAAGPVVPHAMRVLLEGLKRYRQLHPVEACRLRFHFLGTSYVAAGQGTNTILPLAENYGVADQVEEVPHRLGHLECLKLQRDADVLLLPGSSDLAYSPSKIYPYFLADRPILGIVFKQSVMAKILRDLSCAYLVEFDEHESKDEAMTKIAAYFDLALAGFPPGSLPIRNEALFSANYLEETLTLAQCDLFQKALATAVT